MAVTNLVSDAALALLCGQSLLSTLLVAAYRRGLPRPEIPGSEPNVAVILPVRGERNLDRFLPLLRAQQYGRYRIIASVESADDPAFRLLRAAETEPGAPLETTVAGLAANAGQKVWNLLAALERCAPRTTSSLSSTRTRCRRRSGCRVSSRSSSTRAGRWRPAIAG
jgi:hypothetical protein